MLELQGVLKLEIKKNYFIILFGAGDYEIKTINNIVSCTPGTYSAAGKYTLEDELKLISNLKGMIAMDSGNAHMAAMMGVSVITLWGVTHPYAGFKPFNQPFKNCLLADRKKFPKVPTSVYGNKYPKEYEEYDYDHDRHWDGQDLSLIHI